jgi:LacI family transcriptional regulator, galactose operon repressor
MSQINIRTLAKELGLSPGTVSKALKDSYEISIETKERVLALAKKLNYVPNIYASSLRKKRSKTIAVVLPEVADSFFSLAINGIESVAQKKGYHVLIYLTHENFLKEQAILNEFKSGRVDGVLISVTSETKHPQHISELRASGVPVVMFDRVFEDMEIAKVCTNDLESGRLATKHLIENGCRQMAYLSISKSLSITNRRMEGYKKALEDNKLQVLKTNIVFCTNDGGYNYSLIKKLMQRKNRPDGILASVEKLIIAVYQVCRELHLRIPEDVKVISFSNLASATILSPSLTTITQPAFDIGEAAASLLFKSLEKSHFKIEEKNIILPSSLEARDSTK